MSSASTAVPPGDFPGATSSATAAAPNSISSGLPGRASRASLPMSSVSAPSPRRHAWARAVVAARSVPVTSLVSMPAGRSSAVASSAALLRSMNGSVVEASVTACGAALRRAGTRARPPRARVSASSSQLHTARSPAGARTFGGLTASPWPARMVARARRSRGT